MVCLPFPQTTTLLQQYADGIHTGSPWGPLSPELPGIPGLPWEHRVRGSVGLQSNICVVTERKKAKHKKQPNTHVQIIFICSITTIMMNGSDISVPLSAYKYNEKF